MAKLIGKYGLKRLRGLFETGRSRKEALINWWRTKCLLLLNNLTNNLTIRLIMIDIENLIQTTQ